MQKSVSTPGAAGSVNELLLEILVMIKLFNILETLFYTIPYTRIFLQATIL